MSNYIKPINNFNYQAQNVKFSGSPDKTVRGKDYYTYRADKMNPATTSPFALATAYLGISFGSSFLAVHFTTKIVNKKFPKLKNKWLISLGSATVLATAASILTQKMLIKQKKLKPISQEKQLEKENEIKKTVTELANKKGVKLNGCIFYDFNKNGGDNITHAAFDMQTGYLMINTKFKDTNLDEKEVTPFIIHELTHAKQFENIAKSENGLTRLNKIIMRSEIKSKTPQEINQILNTNEKDIPALADKNIHKTDGTYSMTNEELDKKCEIKKLQAIKMYLNNPNVPSESLPVMIDEDYYASAIKGKTPLTAEEQKKVEKYLTYMESDKYINAKEGKIGKSIKSTAAYFDNPIEKEAYNAQFAYIKSGKIT